MRTTRALGVLIACVALVAAAACGREGSPGGSSGGAPDSGLQYPVAQGVQVAGSPSFAAMQQAGRIKFGTKNDQPGLAQQDPATGQYSGFDVEMGRMIAAGLGFSPDKIDYVPVPSAAREDAISRGDVNYYIGSYTINNNRKARVSFAGPYFQAGQDLLVRFNDSSITGPQTLRGKKVCSVSGSTPIQRVQQQQLTEPQNIVQFQNYSQCVDQLLARQVDVVTTDDAILKGYAAQNPQQLKVVGQVFSSEPYGVGLPHDDAALRNKVNDLLQASFNDGTWQRVYNATLGRSGAPASPPALQRY